MYKNKIKIIIGLGEQASEYRSLSKYLDIVQPDWNNGSLSKMKIGKQDILVGFSLGCMIATMYAEKNKVKTLILCSPSPDETLEKVKADKVVFIIGEREKFVFENVKRVAKTLRCSSEIIKVPKSGHKIDKNYQKVLLNLLRIIQFGS